LVPAGDTGTVARHMSKKVRLRGATVVVAGAAAVRSNAVAASSGYLMKWNTDEGVAKVRRIASAG